MQYIQEHNQYLRDFTWQRRLSAVKSLFQVHQIQGVPINIGNQWRLLYRLRSIRHFFMKTIIAVFQFMHLISKTPGLAIFKMCSTLFVSSKLTEILQNLYKFQYISKLSQYPGQLLRLKKCTFTASFLYFLCHAFNIRKQRRHFQVVP